MHLLKRSLALPEMLGHGLDSKSNWPCNIFLKIPIRKTSKKILSVA
ncbi:hypothetical protein NC652_040577 [Populus alba x Populus x berolinensis]|nr:hypothetical protein NC652_040577 [Populus alba x Populus x berolinensis]